MKEVPQSWSAEYMFGLLGYSTWNIYNEDTFVGQVTVNATDRSATWVPAVEPDQEPTVQHLTNFAYWMKWLRRHRRTPERLL